MSVADPVTHASVAAATHNEPTIAGGGMEQLPVASPAALQYFAAHPRRPQVYFGNYLLLQTLGEGEFGKVKLGVHRQYGEETAIKLIKREKVAAAEAEEHPQQHADGSKMSKVEREISVLKLLRHPNIVHLYEVIESERYIGIVLEYGAGGELFDYILAQKCLKERDACRLFAQLISGVSYLHKKKIIHRDLKLENLLLDRNRNVIITDFGFANNFSARSNDLMATSCGSPCYAAPELVVQDGMYVGAAVDVWSCGVILYAMLAGYLPFDDDPANPDGDNINMLYKYIMATPLTFPDYVTAEPRSLLQRMLVPDPAKRATLDEVMAHPWLAPYRDLFRFSVEELENAAIEQQASKRQAYREQIAQQQRLLDQQQRAPEQTQTPAPTVPHSQSVSAMPASVPKHEMPASATLAAMPMPAQAEAETEAKPLAEPPAQPLADSFAEPMPEPGLAPAASATKRKNDTDELKGRPATKPRVLSNELSEPFAAKAKDLQEKQRSSPPREATTVKAERSDNPWTWTNLKPEAAAAPAAAAAAPVPAPAAPMAPASAATNTSTAAATSKAQPSSRPESRLAPALSYNTTGGISMLAPVSVLRRDGPTSFGQEPPSLTSFLPSSRWNDKEKRPRKSSLTKSENETTLPSATAEQDKLNSSGTKEFASPAAAPPLVFPLRETQLLAAEQSASAKRATWAPGMQDKAERSRPTSLPMPVAVPVATEASEASTTLPSGPSITFLPPMSAPVAAATQPAVTPAVASAPAPPRVSLDTGLDRLHAVEQRAPKTAAARGEHSTRSGTAWWRRLSAAPASAAPVEKEKKPRVKSMDVDRTRIDAPVSLDEERLQWQRREAERLEAERADRQRRDAKRHEQAELDNEYKQARERLEGQNVQQRQRMNAIEVAGTMETRLPPHSGAVDQSALTTRNPEEVYAEILQVLRKMGIAVRPANGEFAVECLRPKRLNALERLFSSKRQDSARQKWMRGSGKSGSGGQPRTSSSDIERGMSRLSMSGMPSSATAQSLDTFTMSNTPPEYGSSELGDGGHEVRFSVEMTRIVRLQGLYSVDIRRLKGNVWSYKFLYDTLLARLDLGSHV